MESLEPGPPRGGLFSFGSLTQTADRYDQLVRPWKNLCICVLVSAVGIGNSVPRPRSSQRKSTFLRIAQLGMD